MPTPQRKKRQAPLEEDSEEDSKEDPEDGAEDDFRGPPKDSLANDAEDEYDFDDEWTPEMLEEVFGAVDRASNA